MPANYNHVRLAGNCILGAFVASVATFVAHEVSPKPQTLLIFIPFIVVFTRVLLWVWKRGTWPLLIWPEDDTSAVNFPGREEVADVSSEKVAVDRKAPSDYEEMMVDVTRRLHVLTFF
jgi:hypothetical protein